MVSPLQRIGSTLGGRWAIFLAGGLGLAAALIALLVTVGLAFHAEPDAAFTLANFSHVFGDPFVYRALLNTFAFSAITVTTSLAFGIPIAWLAERTDLPARGWLYPVMTIGILVPGFFNAMGWLLLVHPRMGMLNVWAMQWLHTSNAPFNVISLPGMGLVQGLGLASLIFIMCGSAFRAMDAVLEESAQIHGLSPLRRAISITLPLLWPSILAAIIYVFMLGLAVFDVPAVIGLSSRIYTYSTFVYSITNPNAGGVPNYGEAGASSVAMIAIALILSACYFRVIRQSHRFAVVTGKGYRPKPVRLGRWALAGWAFVGGYLFLSVGLPGCVLLWASLLPFFVPFSFEALQHATLANYQAIPWGGFARAARNSLIIMLVAPTVTVIVSVAISWVVTRSGIKSLARLFDLLAFLPLAIPSVVFAIGAMGFAIFWLPSWVPFYGTVAIIIAVQVIVGISFATRILNAALLQIHRDLDDAAAMFGLKPLAVVWFVLRPLLTPALLSAWLWMALLAYRELTIGMMLVTNQNITLPVFVWGVFYSGSVGQAAALTILLGVCIFPLIVLYFAVARRGMAFDL